MFTQCNFCYKKHLKCCKRSFKSTFYQKQEYLSGIKCLKKESAIDESHSLDHPLRLIINIPIRKEKCFAIRGVIEQIFYIFVPIKQFSGIIQVSVVSLCELSLKLWILSWNNVFWQYFQQIHLYKLRLHLMRYSVIFFLFLWLKVLFVFTVLRQFWRIKIKFARNPESV